MHIAPFKPMLAKPMSTKGIVSNWAEWAVQIKYDGWRLIIEKADGRITSWTRPKGDDDAMAVCELLTPSIIAELMKLPDGVYDSELLVDVPDTVGTDVPAKKYADKRYVVLFDVLRLGCCEVTIKEPYIKRHELLEHAVRLSKTGPKVQLAPCVLVNSEADVVAFTKKVWDAGGEGAILKRRDGAYEPGVRSKNCVKIKRVTHATLTIVGFKPSKGTVRFPGHPFAIVVLRDEDGNETTCKAKDDFELAKLSAKDIGRKLVIEFPKRTRSGGYQGPVRWDRWDTE